MIKIRIAFVLRLLDDFNGQPVTEKGFTFMADDILLHPVVKPDGLYVFTEEIAEDAVIHVQGVSYHEVSFKVDMGSLDPLDPVVNLRLYPIAGKNLAYKYSSYVGSIKASKGMEFPGDVIAVSSNAPELSYKSYRLEEKEHILTLTGFTREQLPGKTWMLRDGKEMYIFFIKEKRGIGEYCIEPDGKPPVSIKSGTKLSRVYRSVTDEKGAYEILVEPGEETNISEVVFLSRSRP